MNRLLRRLRLPALALGLALVAGGVRAEAAPVTESLALPGLSAPGEILIDRWGVPHIYAQTHYDAFFLQGFNAARDRLWQIDLWRRRGLGQLAEVFGPEFIAQDAAARQFLYRGSLFREWLAYGSDAQAIAEAAGFGLTELHRPAISSDQHGKRVTAGIPCQAPPFSFAFNHGHPGANRIR